MSEVQKSADSAAAASGGHEEPDSPAIDQHYVYSLRDFQPFESATYQGNHHCTHETIIIVKLTLLTDWLQVS